MYSILRVYSEHEVYWEHLYSTRSTGTSYPITGYIGIRVWCRPAYRMWYVVHVITGSVAYVPGDVTYNIYLVRTCLSEALGISQ